MIERLNYIEINSKVINALLATKKHTGSIDEKLKAMVEVRISQINGCVYCVDVHAAEARDAGETEQRLDCLAVWHECKFFDERERAALAWAEAVTMIGETHAPDDLYDALQEHFSEQQIVDLTIIIAIINAWNRLAVSFRHLPEAR